MLIVYHNLPQTKSNSWETVGKTCKNKKSRRVAAAAPKAIKVENEIDRKPGSVLNDDLSWFYVAAKLRGPKGPSRQLRDVRGFHICPIRLLLLTGFT